MNKRILMVSAIFLNCFLMYGQNIGSSPEYIKALTSEWKGERFPDGRPKVSDALLERLKNISIEDAWGVLRNKGFQNQFEGDWIVINPDQAMTGRVVTAQYMPLRPDLEKQIRGQGKIENRAQKGGTNSWPIDILVNGDIYVADGYGKTADGTYIQQMMLTSINAPIRIGRATVLPGDVVLAKKYGVIFIPAYLVEELVLTSEFTALRDEFGHQRLREKKYLAGQIDSEWSEEIKKDFLNWLNNYPGKLPMSKEELDNYLKERNY